MPMSIPAPARTGTLLDVELEIPRERRGIAPRPEHAVVCEAHRSELGQKPGTAAPRRVEILSREATREGEAAERADQGSLLIGEVDRLERNGQPQPGVAHDAENLERADHAECSVVTPPPANRIEEGPSNSVRAPGSRAASMAEWLAAASTRVTKPDSSARRWNQARAARCASENVVRSRPPSGVAPIPASASKSARRRSGSTRSVYPERLRAGFDALAGIGATPDGGLERTTFSEAHLRRPAPGSTDGRRSRVSWRGSTPRPTAPPYSPPAIRAP